MNDLQIAVYKRALELWGKDFQLRQLTEEVGELMVAISHHERKRGLIRNIMNEIADVKLMLDQLVVIYEIDPKAVEELCNQKFSRLVNLVEDKE